MHSGAYYLYTVTVRPANSNNITATLSNSEENYTVGTIITLQQAELNGGYGNIDKSVKIVSLSSGAEYLMEYSDNMRFKLSELGGYRIIYTFSDYIGRTAEVSYKINVSDTDYPVFIDDQKVEDALPIYFIAGYDYTLPELRAYCFSDYNDYVDTTVSVDYGTVSYLSFTPSALSSSVRITYTATLNQKSASVSFERPVVSIFNESEGIDMRKLFVGDNITSKFIAINNLNYVAYDITDDTTLRFLNTLCVNDFSMVLRFTDYAKLNFEKATVVLTDSFDPLINIRIDLFKSKKGQLIMRIGDSDIEYSLGTIVNNDIMFKYSGNDGSLFAGKHVLALIGSYNGGKFNGFESRMINVSIEFSGVSGTGTELLISKICNQNMCDDDSDFTKPIISVLNSPVGSYELNKTIVLPETYAFDVISPFITSFNVKITGPSGVIMTSDVASVNPGYSFKLTEFGNYAIVYTATDVAGNRSTKTIDIAVLDNVPPEIVLSGTNVTSAKVNSKIKIVSMTASDAITPQDELVKMIYVLAPDGQVHKVGANMEFTVTRKGRYQIYYFAQDETGNYSTVINYVYVD